MALRAFKNREFQKFVKTEGLTDADLWAAIDEVEAGLVDARLGGFLIKKRVPRPGAGKRGGYRTIMAHRQESRLFLLYGFAKNDRDSISEQERRALRALGELYMGLADDGLEAALKGGILLELRARRANVA